MITAQELLPQAIFRQALERARNSKIPAATTVLRLQVLDEQISHWYSWRPNSLHHVAAGLSDLAARLAFLLASVEAEADKLTEADIVSQLTKDVESMVGLLDRTHILIRFSAPTRNPEYIRRFAEVRFPLIYRKWTWLIERMPVIYAPAITRSRGSFIYLYNGAARHRKYRRIRVTHAPKYRIL